MKKINHDNVSPGWKIRLRMLFIPMQELKPHAGKLFIYYKKYNDCIYYYKCTDQRKKRFKLLAYVRRNILNNGI